MKYFAKAKKVAQQLAVKIFEIWHPDENVPLEPERPHLPVWLQDAIQGTNEAAR